MVATTVCPALAKVTAVAEPMPVLVPVISAIAKVSLRRWGIASRILG
jgi:hypothetical protein